MGGGNICAPRSKHGIAPNILGANKTKFGLKSILIVYNNVEVGN